MSAKNKANELYITRLFDAPVKAVWQAWTDPEQVAQWWGPRGFTITTHSKDLRSGGSWVYTMHGPDGTDYPNKTIYHVVEECSKLVYDHGGNDDRPPLFRVTVLFSELRGKTKMEMTMTLDTAEAAQQIKGFIKQAGGNSTWDRLAEHLDQRVSDRETFVIARSFEAPQEKLFKMWVDPAHLSEWLPPVGFKMEMIKADIREGGTSFYKMFNDAGVTMYGYIHYQKIEQPNRLVYTQQFADKDGRISRHPFAPLWPETMLTTVDFEHESPESIRIKICWEVYGKASAEELEMFIKSRAGMTQGWTGSFDKLDNCL